MSAHLPETLITTYLELKSYEEFRPAYIKNPDVTIMPMQSADIHYYRFLYKAVGDKWTWRDRLLMDVGKLQAILESPRTCIYVLYVQGVPGGYIELNESENGDKRIEVAYFGLRAAFFGRGFGKHLLSYGVEQAWQQGALSVWLHTCNLDGPHALANYQARGFKVYAVEKAPMPEAYRS